MPKVLCPACGHKIEFDKIALRSSSSDVSWYSFIVTKLSCPSCGASLRYSRKTKILIGCATLVAGTGVIWAALNINSDFAPFIFGIAFLSLLLPFLFVERLLGSNALVVDRKNP